MHATRLESVYKKKIRLSGEKTIPGKVLVDQLGIILAPYVEWVESPSR